MNAFTVPPVVSATATATTVPLALSGWRRFSLVRIVLGTLAVVLPVALTMFLVHQLVDKPLRGVWPQLLAAALCVAGYRLYARTVERRAGLAEFSRQGAGRELAAGCALGAAWFFGVIGVLAAAGAWQVAGHDGWTALVSPFTEMLLVALFEEMLFRGVLLRNIERALGSWPALALSGLVFGIAHLPNDGIDALAVGVTVVAGLLLGAAYLATRRLWLAVGLHFAWNFLSDGVFSMATSGHAGKGFLVTRTAGAGWFTGGVYGIEGSVVTLVLAVVVTLALLAVARRRGFIMDRAAARGQAA